MDFVQKFIYQEFIVRNPGQKLLYRESRSVTSMHEKKNSIHTKKARCKIFTNSYKNINMNKLISSTFLYPPPIYPTVFSNKWKRNLSNVERDSLYQRAKKPFYKSLRVLHYSNQESHPAPMPCEHPCHQGG